MPATTATAPSNRHVISNWVEARLWSTLADAERQFVLAVGQFDWFDAALLTAALGEGAPAERLAQLQQLDGLLEAAPREDGICSLHPLLREHCQVWLRRNDPERHAELHERIARAYARRGRIVDALRHAARAENSTLGAAILLDAGGLRIALREGYDRLATAMRFLPPESTPSAPRLTLSRSVVEATAGNLQEARRLLETVPWTAPGEAAGELLEQCADRCLARGIVAFFGGETAASDDTLKMFADLVSLADVPTLDLDVRATMELSLCVVMNTHAVFDGGAERGHRVASLAGNRYPFLTGTAYLQAGQAAMAQGRVREAVAWYRRGDRMGRESFLEDPRLTVGARLLHRELELWRHRLDDDTPPPLPHEIRCSVPLGTYLAAADVSVELTRAARGVAGTITRLETLLDQARRGALPALVRCFAANLAAALAEDGQVDAAQRAWRAGNLPRTEEDCTSLTSQGWREAEALSCARMRLLAALGDHDGSRRLGRALVAQSSERGLRRTAMRAHAVCMAIEQGAGEHAAARARLADFLTLYAEADYRWPLLRERAAGAVLADFLADEPPGARRRTAQRLLAAAASEHTVPRLTARETQVLARLERHRDNDIAAALGLSRPGVRYHVGKLFTKLRVHSRRAAIRRARELGLLPPGS